MEMRKVPVTTRSELIKIGSNDAIVEMKQALENILECNSSQISSIMNNIKETIKGCEASFDYQNEVNIVISQEQVVLNLKQTGSFGKDR